MFEPKKVLLVEDEFILYEQLEAFFKEKGFKIAGDDGTNKAIANYDEAIEVLHKEEPDFAVLDIQINGKKDGLELGAYIKQHYNIPVIFLSAYDNYENLERAKALTADGFVIKLGKPVNTKQLWATISLVLPQIEGNRKRRETGRFLKVKEIDISQLEKKINAVRQQPADPVELKTFIKWDEIKIIIAANKIAKNTILLYTIHYNKGYFYRSTLDEIEALLPGYFTRFNSGTIVNIRAITAEGNTTAVYYVKDMRVEISDTYKEAAFAKLKLYAGDKF